MRWDVIDQGFVCQKSAGARGTDIAIGPRLAATTSGDVVCSFMLSARTATNDFAPVLRRSRDGGRTWSEPQSVWPHLKSEWSIFVGVSRDAYTGKLFLYGTRCRIDVPGESNWSTVTRGLKANDLIWSVSGDDGRTWSEPRTQSASSGDLTEWSDFSFGEPSLVRLDDGTFLAAIWCIQPSGSGIRYVKLRLVS